MKLGTKLKLVIYVMVVVMVVTAITVVLSLKSIEKKQDEALSVRIQQIQSVDNIRVNLGMQGLYARALLIEHTQEDQANLKSHATALDKDIEDMRKTVKVK